MDAESTLRVLLVAFAVAFLVLYGLQVLGVRIQIFGSQDRDDEAK